MNTGNIAVRGWPSYDRILVTMTTVLEPRGPASAIVLTEEQAAALGGPRAPVTVTIAGRTVRLRVARMGGELMIGFSKAARTEAGVEIGQQVEATITPDTEERTVDVPAALTAALAEAGLTESFEALSYSKRKEAARTVADAKQETTRTRRIAAVVDSLR